MPQDSSAAASPAGPPTAKCARTYRTTSSAKTDESAGGVRPAKRATDAEKSSTKARMLSVSTRPAASGAGARHRPMFAGVFGLVHGAGFAGYLKSLFVERIAVPLFGFNVGIELGQIVVLLAAAALFAALDRAIMLVPARTSAREPFHLRLIGVSALVTIVASGWAWDRWPR